MQKDLLTKLESVRWQTASRTFGNNHATLIGLLADWWIHGSPTHWVLESGPAFGYRARDVQGNGQCDAILVDGECSQGIVEVEGTRYEYTLEKIGKFFAAEHRDLETLEFGIFLAYAYTPEGRGIDRKFLPLRIDHFVDIGKAVTKKYTGKKLAILTLDKVFERQRSGPRARNEYYWGSPYQVFGSLVENGEEIERRCIASLKGNET